MNTVHVNFADSKYNYITNVSTQTTEAEAKKYFVGKSFDMGNFPKEDYQKCISIIYKSEADVLKAEIETLKNDFEQYKRDSVKWSIKDMLGQANSLGYRLTDEQAQDALERMIQKHDANYGISWETVNYYVQEYGTKKDESELVEITEAQAIELFNKDIEIWKEDSEETLNAETLQYETLKAPYSLYAGDDVEDITDTDCILFVERAYLEELDEDFCEHSFVPINNDGKALCRFCNQIEEN